MQERAFFDALLSQYIQAQPGDTGTFTVSQVRLYHGIPIKGRGFSGHIQRLIGTPSRGDRPFVILREQRVTKGGDPYTVYHYAKKKPDRRVSPWELEGSSR